MRTSSHFNASGLARGTGAYTGAPADLAAIAEVNASANTLNKRSAFMGSGFGAASSKGAGPSPQPLGPACRVMIKCSV